MKVALFSRFPRDPAAPRGGVETVTLGLTRILAKQAGLDVHVVTLEPGATDMERQRFEGALVHRLPSPRVPQMLDIVAGPGRARLRRFLMDELKPDIVHFHETYGHGVGPLTLPMVFTIHGFDHANIPAERRFGAWLRSPLWKAIESWGLRRQRHIISITPYVREHLAGRTQATIYDVDNPLQPAFFDVQPRTVPGRVFFAGWITPRKNPLTLVEAFAKVIAAGVPASLHLAGEEKDAAYATRVRQAIAKHALAPHVRLMGRVSPEEIRLQLAEAAVFVLPSLQENAPMVIAEAQAAGVPVIAADRCGMPFMVREGQTGYIVEPMDADALSRRMLDLLSDEARRAAFGGAGQADARERYHPDAVAKKTLQVYRHVIAAFPSTRMNNGPGA